jgi:hypothetical protein
MNVSYESVSRGMSALKNILTNATNVEKYFSAWLGHMAFHESKLH